MAETENTSTAPTKNQLINLGGLETFLDESKKIFEPTLPAGTDGQVLKLSEGKPVWGTDNTPTTFEWTDGNTVGPTGTLSGDGMTNVNFGAIPSAGLETSGIVTTGTQTFAGKKTFSETITGNISGNANTATTADKTASGISIKDGNTSQGVAIDSWDGSEAKTLTIKGTAPITTTAAGGEIEITHNISGVTAGTYKSVEVDDKGHVIAGTNPTTLKDYGITDAKIENRIITLGTETITPLTASSTLDAGNVSGVLADGNIPDLSASKITTGTLGIARGGTGLSAVASGDILYASGDNTLATLHKGSDGQVLKIEEGKPAWQVANEFEDIHATGNIHADSMHAERNIYAGNINASTVRVGEQLKAPVHAGNINANTVRIDEQLAASHLQLTADRVIVNERLNAEELHLTATTLSDRGTLASGTEVDGFLEKSTLKFASFSNYSDIGFESDDGMIVSIPGATANYGAQMAFDDTTAGTIKVRGRANGGWGDWKKVWVEGDALTDKDGNPYVTSNTFAETIGNINSALDTINGEVV